MICYLLVSPCSTSYPKIMGVRLSPVHLFPRCHYLQPRADSHGARILAIDDSVLADMFPELQVCTKCAAAADSPRGARILALDDSVGVAGAQA